jgi:hypothetical protein
MTTQSDMAFHLARLGYVIFPIMPGEKRETLFKWSIESTCDVNDVKDWWYNYPTDNIGINCGESSLLVIDLDGDEAEAAFSDLWLSNGEYYYGSSDYSVPVIGTPHGWHLYFEMPSKPLGNSASKLASGVDSRGVGGMVVGPGSEVEAGTYELIAGSLDLVPPLPGWLEGLLRPKAVRMTVKEMQRRKRMRMPWLAEAELKKWCRKIEYAPNGKQNNTINNAAYALALECIPPLELEDVEQELLIAAEKGNHPRDRAEATVRSGLTNGYAAALSLIADEG